MIDSYSLFSLCADNSSVDLFSDTEADHCDLKELATETVVAELEYRESAFILNVLADACILRVSSLTRM